MATNGDDGLGSIWLVRCDPSIGTETRKTRPALIVSGTPFNAKRSKVTVLPFTSTRPSDPRLSPAVVVVPASKQNGLSVDSLLVGTDPMTFDKQRLVQPLGELELEYIKQTQAILRQYLRL